MIGHHLKDNDLHLEKGSIAVRKDSGYVSQLITTRLRLFKGEWFLDTMAGVPWYQDVLGSKNLQRAEFLIKREILGTEGVDALTSFSASFDRSTRRYTVNFTFTSGGNSENLEVYFP